MITQFYRTEILLGAAAMSRLRRSTVAVFGVGGVGSFTVEALARAGVGHLILIDHDVVDVTNINRQLHATMKTIGRSKVSLMRERILDINPECIVDVIEEFYVPSGDVGKFFIADYDCVVDAIDTVESKVGLISECNRRNLHVISSMGAGNKLDPTAFRVGDIYETSIDPLARILRHRLRELNISHLRVVYSTEPPRKINLFPPTRPLFPVGNRNTAPPAAPSTNNSARKAKIIGSVSFVPSVAGLIIAGEVVKFLAGDSL